MALTEAQARALIGVDGLGGTLDLLYPIAEAKEAEPGIDVRDAEICYRRFLYVCWFGYQRDGSVKQSVICGCADAVWHQHILVTRQYRADCETIFGPGVYLNHEPGDFVYQGVAVDPTQTQAAALQLYRDAGVSPCPQLRHKCAWCITP
ncbi:MAG: hypothetical protein E6J41_19145 [Chloroflexi bacterium]|nr:MAG: hypothetical protein E6J41_19145 [Chloroflexota bacterium]